MANELALLLKTILIGKAKIGLQDLRLREDILLDDVRLEGEGVRIDLPETSGVPPHVETGEVKFSAMMTEANVNRLVQGNLPANAPVRNLQLTLLTGRAKVSGQYVKLIPIPFVVEIVPQIENGVRVRLALQSSPGLPIPKPILDAIESHLNHMANIDLSGLPVAVRLDEIRCEPGRITTSGKIRVEFPFKT